LASKFLVTKKNSKKNSTKFHIKNSRKKIPTDEKFSKGLGTISIEILVRSELDKTVVTPGHRQALMTAFVKPQPKITTI
jgi:hypothetical protein